MSSEGLGELTVFEGVYGVALSFAGLSVSAETYDIGLLRLAGAILEDDRLASVFVAHLGGSTALKSAMR